MTAPKLNIAPGTDLPLDAVTSTFAFLAKRGAGKTYAALVLAEELIGAGQRVVVIDPVGVTWGLRSSATGKGPGLSVVIFGGEHGDLPLDVQAGEAVADAIVDAEYSAIIDLSLLRKKQRITFLAAFVERIYHRNRKPLHLMLDEADDYAPQKPWEDGAERLLGAIDDLVRRGRARGFGVSLISQRAAVLNKNVLSQIETLVALRTLGKHDREAIDGWIEAHGSEAERDGVMATLALLENGEAWIWSPTWLKILKRIQFRRRHTFDSSATPKPGERRIEPTASAKIDLDAIKLKIAEMVKRAEAEHPTTLKRRIAELEKALAAKNGAAPIDVAAVREEGRKDLRRDFDDACKLIEKRWRDARDAVIVQLAAIRPVLDKALNSIVDGFAHGAVEMSKAGRSLRGVDPVGSKPVMEFEDARMHAVATARVNARVAAGAAPRAVGPAADNQDITGPMQRILDAMEWLRTAGLKAPFLRTQVALIAGYSPTSSSYVKALGALNSAALAEYGSGDRVSPTAAGSTCAAQAFGLTTVEDLHRRVLERLDGPKRRCLENLLRAPSRRATRSRVAEAAGYSVTSSSFVKALGGLRSIGIVEYPDSESVEALPWLFLEDSK